MKPPINESHPERVAPRLKLLRKLSNMTQKELCELLEIQPGTYNHYERGLNLPTERAYFYEGIRRVFVSSDDETLSGKPVEEVVDELLAEQDNAYSESLPPS